MEYKFKTYEEASAALNKAYPNTTPKDIFFFEENGIEYSAWTGSRRFPGQTDWCGYKYVLFSNDNSKLHLSEYWGSEAGIYTKL